ncbi:hypothetical protein L218DRAFT_31043 [Marasmius fiardii PR-910]|nr:hypothetical protein L218DRAFT_31043 [Marasmius fiardii PR-910]
MSRLFIGDGGNPIKFYIQEDISQEVKAHLLQTIPVLGGEVVGGTIPPSGSIVLIELGKPDAERLLGERTRPDLRLHVVPYTYIEACRSAGALLKQIFVEEPGSQPMAIHLHESLANPKFRDEMCLRILYAGGNPFATFEDCRVIIADSKTEIFTSLIKATHHTPNKYVESLETLEAEEQAKNGHNSVMMMNGSFVNGSLSRFRSRRQVAEPATSFTFNYAR